jgi:hypothetical protein
MTDCRRVSGALNVFRSMDRCAGSCAGTMAGVEVECEPDCEGEGNVARDAGREMDDDETGSLEGRVESLSAALPAGLGSSEVPHIPQNRNVPELFSPHFGQITASPCIVFSAVKLLPEMVALLIR